MFTVRYELYYSYELLALEVFINACLLIPAQSTGGSFRHSVCVCVCFLSGCLLSNPFLFTSLVVFGYWTICKLCNVNNVVT